MATTENPGYSFIQDQELLGWDWFLEGWLSKNWQSYQELVWHGACSQCRTHKEGVECVMGHVGLLQQNPEQFGSGQIGDFGKAYQ